MKNILKLLQRDDIQSELRDHQIKHIWLTGSYAHWNANKDSDVDILVTIDKSLPRKNWGIFGAKAFLEDKIGLSVDLIPIKSIDKHIKASLLEDKIAIW